ncbi:hypothetical protein G7069_09185 [Lysobacter sp. HDW10]|uniref:hypothetical protein n=1 Tax=Lysobacter sp. HDW10 TaxID=2714936 RepID=UPI001408655C|nr:hypothetical protein [Lysobacter sp. HDW10]QIK81751.1 hypothetical protein G7069_09185 [Lysobacter sp. HDW10]
MNAHVMPPPVRTLEDHEVAIAADYIPDIRRMLAIGLHAFGEMNRVREQMDAFEEHGIPFTYDMRPVTIGSYEVANFADVLLYLEGLETR